MTEIVAERGYANVKVRDVVKLAGVSTRSFYEHFSSKEDCFIRTYELLARQATRRIIAAQVDEDNWRLRPHQVFDSFSRGVASDPAAASVVLIEAYKAGPAVLEHVWRSERTFEAMIAESLARRPGGVEVPSLVVEGMVAGIAHIARTRLASGRIGEMPALQTDLMVWALSFPHRAALALAELDMRSGSVGPRATQLKRLDGSSGDRALILAAVGKLVASDGYGTLTIPRIRSAAGISRRKFDNHFNGVEECFVATLELHASEALAKAATAQAASRSWPGGVYRAIDTLCEQMTNDPFLASVCIADGFVLSSSAARCRERLADAVTEQLRESVPADYRTSRLATEASAGALWALFQRHVARSVALKQQRPQVSPTLSYLVLAPSIGPSAALNAIRSEQDA